VFTNDLTVFLTSGDPRAHHHAHRRPPDYRGRCDQSGAGPHRLDLAATPIPHTHR